MKKVTYQSALSLFEQWYAEALKLPVNTPSAMVLSSVDEDGRPSSRVVLLKQWDQKGFVFYTNVTSRKAKNLDTNPYASLLFYWDNLRKQVRIEGAVEKVSSAEAQQYFQTRPLESRWGTWASKQSESLKERAMLEERYLYFQRKYPEDVPTPKFWGGYRLKPDRFEFWENGEFRLHHRLLFEKQQTGWVSDTLYP
ncbi:MAG: pyridoxamine 5'-phosphate oxidase [Proteobacteria bacterium]|nr:pyridoxamine 5'-phosphate oxidase [Pseudomonadota bacterium]